jgi:hypothetical protein
MTDAVEVPIPWIRYTGYERFKMPYRGKIYWGVVMVDHTQHQLRARHSRARDAEAWGRRAADRYKKLLEARNNGHQPNGAEGG